jgi:predicted nicotinamide N-methyase
MFSLDQFHQTYDTVATPVKIDGHALTLFTPASLDRFIDPNDLMHDFPLWAKIWEASGLLASYLFRLPPDPQKTMLEIGCGLGMVGIAAAKAGHRITMTEINPDALNFARANALANGCPELAIQRLDWNAPQVTRRFDYIVGSETVYRSEDIDGLEALFDRHLRPDGIIVLAEGVRRTGVDFWERMRRHYDVKAQRQILRSDQGTQHMLLFRLKRKQMYKSDTPWPEAIS